MALLCITLHMVKVPAPKHLEYSLHFLHTILVPFPNQLQYAWPVEVHCDNEGIIQKLNNSQKPVPTITVTNDYDVYAEILHNVSILQPLTIWFSHVQGHQDQQKAINQLSLPSQLNIDCDSCANQALPCLQQYSIFLPNPLLLSSYPHLTMHGKLIVQEIPEAIQHAATMPDYHMHLKTKHKWTNNDSIEVNWPALSLALKRFKLADFQYIQKFLHDWLPYHDSPWHGDLPETQQLCPSCQQNNENYWHFLECSHPHGINCTINFGKMCKLSIKKRAFTWTSSIKVLRGVTVDFLP